MTGDYPLGAARRYAEQIGNGRPTDAAALTAARGEAEYDALLDAHAERLLQRKLAPIDVVPTPFPSWSAACRDEGGGKGLPRGWHVTVAARTGLGKSVCALNCAWHAVQSGECVFFISLEMSQVQLETRLLAIASGTPIRVLEQGSRLNAAQHRKAARLLTETCAESGGRFVSNRRQYATLQQVEGAIRRAAEEEGCRLAIVDYIQLAAADPNDPREITLASHAVRRLAQDLAITTIALSQFNRETSKADTRPSVHGLMGGSAIENDSDQVLLIDHSRMTRPPAPAEGWHGIVMLAKNRHGPLSEIPVAFDSTTLRIRERLPDEV